MKIDELKEILSYLKEPEIINKTRNKLLEQVQDYINCKCKNSNIIVDYENNIITIEGDNKEEILIELNNIGLINNDEN